MQQRPAIIILICEWLRGLSPDVVFMLIYRARIVSCMLLKTDSVLAIQAVFNIMLDQIKGNLRRE